MPSDLYMTLNYNIYRREVIYERDFNNITKTLEAPKTYTICISRWPGFKPDMNKIYYPQLIYRNDYIFLPNRHTLEEIGIGELSSLKKENFMIGDDAICVGANIKYSKDIQDYEWEFINVTHPSKSIKLQKSIGNPFIASLSEKPLYPGYYNVIFRYRLTEGNQINEIRLDSAFYKQ